MPTISAEWCLENYTVDEELKCVWFLWWDYHENFSHFCYQKTFAACDRVAFEKLLGNFEGWDFKETIDIPDPKSVLRLGRICSRFLGLVFLITFDYCTGVIKVSFDFLLSRSTDKNFLVDSLVFCKIFALHVSPLINNFRDVLKSGSFWKDLKYFTNWKREITVTANLTFC